MALIETKLSAPRLRRGLVPRPAALMRLDLGADARLTLVSAPAGFGKTTLLSRWVADQAGSGRRIAWLSLDEHDREPASFIAYVVTALQRAVPGIGTPALEALAASPTELASALTTVLNEVASFPDELWLVLDDYHLVEGDDVGRAMSFLVEHLPPQMHVVLGTRADPALPLARLRARGQLVEVRAADLRFSRDEAATYLASAGIDLSSEDVGALTERTEGWIAALQLAALSLRNREDGSDFVRRFAGDDRYVVDYLMEEVLAHQPEHVRSFLLRTSILERLSGSLCDAVLGRNDSAELLDALDRSNLFLVALDDRREWYRYHQLFADVLRARLRNERRDELSALHQRASRWYEQQGLSHDAIEHAIAGRDFERAARLMELAAPSIRRDRQDAILLGWLLRLPHDTVRHSPVLSAFAGYSRMLAGDLDGAEEWFQEAERELGSAADGTAPPWSTGDELRTLPATIAVYRASNAQARGDVEATAAYAHQALGFAGPNDHQARSGGAGFLGLAEWARGDVTSALRWFSEAVGSLHAGGILIDELQSTVILADLWITAGRPDRARRLYDEALGVAEQHGGVVARAAAALHVGLGELDIEAGDLGAGARHLEVASDATGPNGMPESHYRWFVARAALARAEGDIAEAIRLLDAAAPLYNPGFFPDVRPVRAIRARVSIAQGDLAAAVDWASERGLSPDDAPEFRREFEHLTLARLLLATGELDRARELLDRLLLAAEAAQRRGSVLEIQVLQSLALDLEGRTPEAVDLLADALAAVPDARAHTRLLLNEGPPMAELLRLVGQRRGDLAHVAALGRPRNGAGERATPRARSPVLSDRELQVVRLLDSELTGPEIARRLFVSQNTLRTHTKHIFTKLGVTSRRAAVLRAHERGLL
jgi:LuxR family maltose regulon positive regulatory protein